MKEEVRDLLTSKGWTCLIQALEERKASLFRELMTQTDISQITRAQAAIRELNYVVGLPHELLQSKEEEDA